MTTDKKTHPESSATLPRSIARGELTFEAVRIECHVLDDERRVVSARGMVAALTASGVKEGNSERRIARILGENSGVEVGPRIRFTARGGTHVGYAAEFLPRLCTAITDRAIEGKLHHKQTHIAAHAWRIVKALAGVGIVALVDEATGYQTQRAPDALSKLFARYLLREPGEWSRAIPEELYVGLARLYRHQYTEGQAQRPHFFRSWTWRYVYGFLPAEVRSELQRRNPAPHEGSTRHHQHLSPHAREVLTAHLLRLTTVVRQSASPDDFHMRFGAEFQGAGLQLSLDAN